MAGRLTSTLLLAALLVSVLAVPAAAAAEITITDSGASPESASAEVGETIVWTNSTDETITLSGDDPMWTSGPLGAGQSFSLSFETAGTYTYASSDGEISGEVEVSGAPDAGDGDGDGDGTDGEVIAGDTTLPATGAPGLLVPIVIALFAAGAALLAVTRRLRRR